MSLCLIVESKDCVWLGGDTAVSYEVNGKHLRGHEEMEKAFCHSNAVFMCGGSVQNALSIRRYIKGLPVITHDSILRIAARLRGVVEHERRVNPDYNVQTVLLLALLDTGRVYGISEMNDFVVESPVTPQLSGFKDVCCIGVVDEDGGRGCKLARKYHAETHDIPHTYSKVYSDLSSNGVGGHVDLYRLDVKRQTITKYTVPIKEREIEYVNASAVMNSGSISWGNVNSDPVATNAASTANSAYSLANTANGNANAASDLAKRIANGTFSGGTFINGREIYSPTIRANEFVVQPSDVSSRTGGYSIYGYFGSTLYNMFRLNYFAGDGAYINFDSPASAYANWNFKVSNFGNSGSQINYYGNVNFSGAKVTGITAVFG